MTRIANFMMVLGAALSFSLGLDACNGSYGTLSSTSTLEVTIVKGDRGTVDARLPISLDKPIPFTVKIVARKPDGTPDEKFNGFVRLTAKPGGVKEVTGPGATGRNAFLKNGVADNIGVGIVGSYGDTHIWAEDVGYVPADPVRMPPPQCSDGVDNNGNGLVDFPADPGCAFSNDDSEDGGTFGGGVTDTIFFSSPRIENARGIQISPVTGLALPGSSTPFPHEQLLLDTGYRPRTNSFNFSVIVTRIASDGFYATDIEDDRVPVSVPQTPGDGRHGSSSVFAYNFSAPPKLRVCDRLTTFTGTAADFFGFTELGFPTWSVEEYDPARRDCLVPEPYVFEVSSLGSTAIKLRYESAMVRLIAGKHPISGALLALHVTKHFGLNFPKAPAFAPTDDASNCDLNGNGKVEFNVEPEKSCAAACGADVECSEYTNFSSRSEFRLVLVDQSNPDPTLWASASIQANAAAAARVNPLQLRGVDLRSFTGTFRYFSGGSQFTIEARCDDDLVTDLTANPLPANKACVYPRTASDQNGASN